jgi:sulfur-oxidizing protein SoxY
MQQKKCEFVGLNGSGFVPMTSHRGTTMLRAIVTATTILALLAGPAFAVTIADPLDSPVWESIRDDFLPGGEIIFDDRVDLVMPTDIENSTDVPLAIRIDPDVGDVVEIVVIAENNPIQTVARLMPHRPLRSIGLKIRLETSTPVRVAVLTDDNVWHVGSEWANVLTPGGCSAPIVFSEAGEGSRLGEIAMKTFEREDGGNRLKFRIVHPMETGFAFTPEGEEIPAYYVERIEISDEAGKVVDVITHAAMAPDPIITLDVPELRQSLRISARDSEGLEFEAFH